MEKNDEKIENTSEKKYKYGIPSYMLFVIGFVYFGSQMFGFYESQLLNTFIIEVLNTPNKYDEVALMVGSSAFMGLVFLFVFGILSDNTRSKFGRRRPYILIGGLVGGSAMIFYGFSPNFFICYILDVIAMGIASNCYYAPQRVLIPDLVEIDHRGRANGMISLIGTIGMLIAVIASMVVEPMFPKVIGTETVMNREGHILLLSIGGIMIIISGIIGFIFIREPSAEGIPKKKFIEELKSTFDFKELKKHNEFFKLMIGMLIFNTGIQLVLPFLFDFIFKVGVESLLPVLSLAAPVLVLTIFILGKLVDSIGRKKIIPPVVVISSIGFILIPFSVTESGNNTLLLAIAFSFVLVGLLGVVVPLGTWSQDLLPKDQRGKFMGILNIVNTLNQIVGVVIGGFLLNSFMGADKIAQAYEMALVFPFVMIFFLLSVPFLLRVKETLPTAQNK